MNSQPVVNEPAPVQEDIMSSSHHSNLNSSPEAKPAKAAVVGVRRKTKMVAKK